MSNPSIGHGLPPLKRRKPTWRKSRRRFNPAKHKLDPITKDRLDQLFGKTAAIIKSPVIRLSIDSTVGAPALTSMLKNVLEAAGAQVVCKDKRVTKCEYTSLAGLTIHIGQLTWVREEEAERWAQ